MNKRLSIKQRALRDRRKQARREKKDKRVAENKAKKETHEKWITKIKERDNYTCQICGKKFDKNDCQYLQVAHILAKETYPELKYDDENVLSLCYKHHRGKDKLSNHLNGFVFVHWFEKKFKHRYYYLLNKIDKDFYKNEC